jgi:hypothetical protein
MLVPVGRVTAIRLERAQCKDWKDCNQDQAGEGETKLGHRRQPGHPELFRYVEVEKCLNKDYLSLVCDCHATHAKDKQLRNL